MVKAAFLIIAIVLSPEWPLFDSGLVRNWERGWGHLSNDHRPWRDSGQIDSCIYKLLSVTVSFIRALIWKWKEKFHQKTRQYQLLLMIFLTKRGKWIIRSVLTAKEHSRRASGKLETAGVFCSNQNTVSNYLNRNGHYAHSLQKNPLSRLPSHLWWCCNIEPSTQGLFSFSEKVRHIERHQIIAVF